MNFRHDSNVSNFKLFLKSLINMTPKDRVVVCDFPSQFLFPPTGYGGIERWLWSVAKRSDELGCEVVLSGPQWRSYLLPQARHYKDRIEHHEKAAEFIKTNGRFDILIAGHEYFDDPDIVESFKTVAENMFTYQLTAKPYTRVAHGDRCHLFCFSDEMMRLYADQKPKKMLVVGEGEHEDPIPLETDNYLVWVGRLDKDKSPHYAVLAARKLGMDLFILGDIQYQPEYRDAYRDVLFSDGVKHFGVVSGKRKMELIGGAKCAFYTASPDWTEAAGLVLSECIRSGVPVAGMTWKGDDSVVEAVGDNEGGYVNKIPLHASDKDIADALEDSARRCFEIKRENILNYGNSRYNPRSITEKFLSFTVP